jgi:hypothetical protein
MTNIKFTPPPDDRLDSANTTMEGGQNSQMNTNRDISQKKHFAILFISDADRQ